MEIICPTCNKSYNIPVERLPKKRVSAKCKNCGQTMQIESSGVTRPRTPVTSPVAFADGKRKPSPGHAILLDYPELQKISPDRVALDEIFSPNKKGSYRTSRNKLKVKILLAVSEVLDKLLNQGETVMRVGKGIAHYPTEILLGNGWLTMMYNHYAILATDQRLLFININSRVQRTTHYLFQMLYEDIKKIKRGLLGSLAFQRLKSKRRVFTGVKRFVSKELKDFIMEKKDHAVSEPREALESICPSCYIPLQKGLQVCPSCKANFKNPRNASLRSLLLPGLGDLYLGHRALGSLELAGSLIIWVYALASILSGQREALFVAVFVLLLFNGVDALLTYHMAKKGYMLA
jgi:hypothetical protein